MSKRRPTFVVQEDLVRIYVRGVPHPKGFPYIPDDQGVGGELLKAMLAEELPYDVRSETTGGGVLVALWRKDDAAKVIAWLEARADRVEEHPKK